MNIYFILYSLFVIFNSATNGAYAQFRGASKKVYNFLGSVTAIGVLAFIAFSVIHFFVLDWWAALLLIIGTLIVAPIIGMRMGRNLFFIIVSPYLTIIFAIAFLLYALYKMNVIQIISV